MKQALVLEISGMKFCQPFLPEELKQMCVSHHYTSLYQQVLQQLLQTIAIVVPQETLGLIRRDGIWQRVSLDRKLSRWVKEYDIMWGKAVEGYQDYAAETVLDSTEYGHQSLVIKQWCNEAYIYADFFIGWERNKPWRDIWYEDEKCGAKNMWAEPLCPVFARGAEVHVV